MAGARVPKIVFVEYEGNVDLNAPVGVQTVSGQAEFEEMLDLIAQLASSLSLAAAA